MRVAPHPHMGLQTVSWLVSGEVLLCDCVGSRRLVTPGQLNLMIAGQFLLRGEPGRPLAEADRNIDPHFEHHPDRPTLTDAGSLSP